jgi:hypothetical protein
MAQKGHLRNQLFGTRRRVEISGKFFPGGIRNITVCGSSMPVKGFAFHLVNEPLCLATGIAFLYVNNLP